MKNTQQPFFLAAVALCLLVATHLHCHGRAGGENLGLRTVCIDAGHGGHDPGCISKDRKTYEKSVVLSISSLLADKIRKGYPEVKVVMTRSEDKAVALNERAAIANRNDAGLFISIHINAAQKGTSANGFSVHVLGQSSDRNRDLFRSNLELCRRENSVILLEEDYSTKYEGFNPDDPESFIFFNLMHNANLEQSLAFAEEADRALAGGPIKNNRGISQDPFLVLWRTKMPSVLIECGFMSNPSDLETLRSAKGREEIATRLFKAFSSFKTKYDKSLAVESSNPASPAGAPESGLRDGLAAAEPASAATARGESTSSSPDSKPSDKALSAAAATQSTGKETPSDAAIQSPGNETDRRPSAKDAAHSKDSASSEKDAATAIHKKKPETAAGSEKTLYGVQILATGRDMDEKDSFFKGYTPLCVKSDKINKYIIGVSSSEEEAKKTFPEIRKIFPDSFLVVTDGKTAKPLRR